MMFVAGVAIFSAGSLACGLSGGLLALNLSRILQGCGAALIVPSTLALLRETHPDRHERARAIAIYAASGGIAQVSGPVLGGFLVSAVGWRSIFFVNVPFGILVLIAAIMRIPRSSAKPNRRLDLPGQITAVIWLLLLAVALIEGGQLGWTSSPVVVCFALSFVALVAFGLVERNTSEPMLPIEDFRHFRTASLVVISIIMFRKDLVETSASKTRSGIYPQSVDAKVCLTLNSRISSSS
jgi:MFS transporter, DHA2 family, methylenomycin A resistance protein